MFVAGLSPSTRDRSVSDGSAAGRQSGSRRPSDNASSTLDPSSAAGSVGLSLISPLTSPNPTPHLSLPSSPPSESTSSFSQPPDVEVDEREKEFMDLVENLRGALAPRGGKGKVWLPLSERKDFRIVLVEKASLEPSKKPDSFLELMSMFRVFGCQCGKCTQLSSQAKVPPRPPIRRSRLSHPHHRCIPTDSLLPFGCENTPSSYRPSSFCFFGCMSRPSLRTAHC